MDNERPKILIVDDRRENRLALQAALAPTAYELVLVGSGEEALHALLKAEFAAILMDVAMPGLDGFQTARIIRERERTRRIPIIFVTAVMAELAHTFEGSETGAVDYLIKPVDTHALRAKVDVFVELWRQGKEIERAGNALREAERRERTFIESMYDVTFEEAPIGIGHLTLGGKWLRGNVRLTSILGVADGQLGESTIYDFVHADDRERLADAIATIAEDSHARHKGEYRLAGRRAPGTWIALTISLIRDISENPIHLVIVEDITNEKRLALALEASERRFVRLREAGLIGIFHEDPDGTIRDANEAFLSIVGYTREDLEAGRLRAASLSVDGEDASVHAALPGSATTLETEYVCKDGSRAAVLVGAVADPEGLTGFALDITAAKEAERERARALRDLQESVRARDDFLYIAAHELRNPLTPLLIQVMSLREAAVNAKEPIAPVWLANQLEVAERASLRLGRLMDELLDVSQATIGMIRLEVEDVDLAQIVREVLDRMHHEIQRANIRVTLRAEVPVRGSWDRVRLEQVVANLLSNAVKYGEGNPIEVTVEGTPEEASLSVRDYGIGIARNEQARLFERFARLVSIRHYGGFGLGLWIVRQIVEAHGGRIEVWSEPSEGSRFTVILPRVSPPRPAEEEKEQHERRELE